MNAHKLWRQTGGEAETVFLSAAACAAVDRVHADDVDAPPDYAPWSRITTTVGRTFYYAGTPEETVRYLDRFPVIKRS